MISIQLSYRLIKTQMRPSEPFVTEFLSNGEWRNVTSEQVNRDIYPFGTYSYLAQLCVVFLITDILRFGNKLTD
jgi:thiamine transporter 2/3